MYAVRKLETKSAQDTYRQSNKRQNKQVIEWTPYGNKIKQGRPITRRWDEGEGVIDNNI